MDYSRLVLRVWLVAILLTSLLQPRSALADETTELRADGPTLKKLQNLLSDYKSEHPEAARPFPPEYSVRFLKAHKNVRLADTAAGRGVQFMLLNLVSMFDRAPLLTSATRSKPFSRAHSEGRAIDLLTGGSIEDFVRAEAISKVGGKNIFVQVEVVIDGIQYDVRFRDGDLYRLAKHDKLASFTHTHVALWKDVPFPYDNPYEVLPEESNVPHRWVFPSVPRSDPRLKPRRLYTFSDPVAQPPVPEAGSPAPQPQPPAQSPSPAPEPQGPPESNDAEHESPFERIPHDFDRPRPKSERPSYEMEWGPATMTWRPGPRREK